MAPKGVPVSRGGRPRAGSEKENIETIAIETKVVQDKECIR